MPRLPSGARLLQCAPFACLCFDACAFAPRSWTACQHGAPRSQQAGGGSGASPHPASSQAVHLCEVGHVVARLLGICRLRGLHEARQGTSGRWQFGKSSSGLRARCRRARRLPGAWQPGRPGRPRVPRAKVQHTSGNRKRRALGCRQLPLPGLHLRHGHATPAQRMCQLCSVRWRKQCKRAGGDLAWAAAGAEALGCRAHHWAGVAPDLCGGGST